ncbi:MAG: protein kinase [Sandaracinaceae bacterium]
MESACRTCGQSNHEGARFCLKCGSSLEANDDPLIGQVVQGRYRVGSILGEGGMGRVYRATQQMGSASRDVAIKVLHGEHSVDPTLRRRFDLECEVVIHLTHPNTIRFYDFGALDDGRLFIVMEFIDGHSIGRELDLHGPMDATRVEHLVDQVAGSLAEAHDRGVVHRDLKPDNVLLTERGGEEVAKVVDFGVAKRQDDNGETLTLQGTVIGTPRYMSPEQLTAMPVDARSDVYALGLLAYEMLTGAPPFEAKTPSEWASKHTTATPEPFAAHESTRDLPLYRANAILRALAKLPEDRFESTVAFAAAFSGREGKSVWSAATADTMAATPAAMMAADALKPAGLKRRWPWMVGIALLALGIAAAVYVVRLPAHIEADPSPDPVVMDAGADTGPAVREPSEWLRIVHFQRAITHPSRALGPPDESYAIVHRGGTLTLELEPGRVITSDGTDRADITIAIDEGRSSAYRADVGVDRNQFTTVGSELLGSLSLDTDQFQIEQVRYIRIKNRGTSNLYVDAVGGYGSADRE